MGILRFIADLYKNSLLPGQVVNLVYQELVIDFLESYDPIILDDGKIERIVELLDQIGI